MDPIYSPLFVIQGGDVESVIHNPQKSTSMEDFIEKMEGQVLDIDKHLRFLDAEKGKDKFPTTETGLAEWLPRRDNDLALWHIPSSDELWENKVLEAATASAKPRADLRQRWVQIVTHPGAVSIEMDSWNYFKLLMRTLQEKLETIEGWIDEAKSASS